MSIFLESNNGILSLRCLQASFRVGLQVDDFLPICIPQGYAQELLFEICLGNDDIEKLLFEICLGKDDIDKFYARFNYEQKF